MLLFEELLTAVTQGNEYVQDTVRAGNQIRFDHGALLTLPGPEGGIRPAGEKACTRIKTIRKRSLQFFLNEL